MTRPAEGPRQYAAAQGLNMSKREMANRAMFRKIMIAGTLLLSVSFGPPGAIGAANSPSAPPDLDCRSRAAQALGVSYRIAGRNLRQFIDTINQQFRLLGINRERFRSCFPEGEVVLKKIEQCAQNNEQICTYSQQETEQANQELAQRNIETPQANGPTAATTAIIKGDYASACKALDDARQFSNGSISASEGLPAKVKSGDCFLLNSGSVKIVQRSGRLSCIKYNDTGPCLWISNNWFVYPIRWDIPVNNIGEGAACLTLRNAMQYRNFHLDYDTRTPPEFPPYSVDDPREIKYLADIDCWVLGPGWPKARIVDQTVVSGLPMVCIQELQGEHYDLGPCYWTRPDIWERSH
jgi:hypothetical protein